nr:isoprenylcysteine carboxylmethyltransferase family protein [Rhizobium sp. SSA_523]
MTVGAVRGEMEFVLILLFVIGALVRVSSVLVSRRHESALRKAGAMEYGALNTRLLALAHIAFYIACLCEGLVRETRFDPVSLLGLLLYAAAIGMLVWIVQILGPLWTVKIMIARQHEINRHFLFRTIRHPNYFLNILPELLGFALMFHAYLTLMVGLPVYGLFLAIRIHQEEAAMRALAARQQKEAA